MSFEISFGLVCLGQFESVSDQHRMVRTLKPISGMGWLSLYDGLLRAPTVLITTSINAMMTLLTMIYMMTKITKIT